ncbi:MAG: type III sulfide quinone reductase, selenoprotein subtype [Nocardioides sp.]
MNEAGKRSRRLLILGGGTAGTMAANRLVRWLDRDEWSVTVVDHDDRHLYQPGLLFVPFDRDRNHERSLVRSRRDQLAKAVEVVTDEVVLVEPEQNRVTLSGGQKLSYDYLVIATGSTPRPEETPGLSGSAWRDSIFDFYTLEGACALGRALPSFQSGRLVVHVSEVPIKCPVAPLEFAFLADAYLRRRGIRDSVELTYVTPLDGAFTRPVAARHLNDMLDRRGIRLEPDFVVERVDPEGRTLHSYDDRQVPFDLLVSVPVHRGADFVGDSGLGDELNHVPVDPHTFESTDFPHVFALGDAADLPTSKAGSTAHFAVESFTEDFLARVAGQRPPGRFDGHANCFVEAGDGRALLLDFDYDVEPLPGDFPIPRLGPLRLLKETRLNHLGKLAFGWAYWHLLLPGRPLPVSTRFSMRGKARPALARTGATPSEE